MTEKKQLGSMTAVNKKVALIKKQLKVEKPSLLINMKKSLLTIVKNSLSVSLWIIAGLVVFITIIGMSVFACYLNGQQRKKGTRDLSAARKFPENRPY